jgi:hypothetical protein
MSEVYPGQSNLDVRFFSLNPLPKLSRVEVIVLWFKLRSRSGHGSGFALAFKPIPNLGPCSCITPPPMAPVATCCVVLSGEFGILEYHRPGTPAAKDDKCIEFAS